MLLLFVSFVGGVLTVLAPCILPLLPVIVGGSLADGKINIKKALTVVVSLGVSVIAFTFILKVSSLFINIPQYTWTLISGGIILILGIVTIFPNLWEGEMTARLSAKSNIFLGKGNRKKNFWGDVIVGSALGPVFSTCSPTYFIVLATVLPVNLALGIVYLLSYTVGLCLALFAVVFLGQKIMSSLDVAADPRGVFKKILGVLFVLVGIAILTGVDKQLENAITGAGFFDATKIEQKLLQKNTTPDSRSTSTQQDSSTALDTPAPPTSSSAPKSVAAKITYLTALQKQLKYQKAPELVGISGYINTDGKPITLAELKGKVVLLDIWTYSCINCQRTIPYINKWYAKYKDQGFVVVGVHTPEFAFEKVLSNVEKAVKDFGIKYPVVLDSEYATWKALGNNFWPRKYLIDIDGYIVYDHIGEGEYDITEKAIQDALKERASRMGMDEKISSDISAPSDVVSFDNSQVKSPEVYFGSARNQYLGNGTRAKAGVQNLTMPSVMDVNKFYLNGTWDFLDEYAENKNPASIVFKYDAKNVYMASGSKDGVEVSIYRDDVFVKKIMIKDETLYPLITGSDYGKHTLRIEIPTAGLQAFTFTFG